VPKDVGSIRGHREQRAPPARSHERADRWPKPAAVTGPEQQMRNLRKIPGVQVFDHGQHRVHPDQWQIQVEIRDARTAEALRERGIKVELWELPTAQELEEDVGGRGASGKPIKRRQ
jgi:hypothetical protein